MAMDRTADRGFRSLLGVVDVFAPPTFRGRRLQGTVSEQFVRRPSDLDRLSVVLFSLVEPPAELFDLLGNFVGDVLPFGRVGVEIGRASCRERVFRAV